MSTKSERFCADINIDFNTKKINYFDEAENSEKLIEN